MKTASILSSSRHVWPGAPSVVPHVSAARDSRRALRTSAGANAGAVRAPQPSRYLPGQMMASEVVPVEGMDANRDSVMNAERVRMNIVQRLDPLPYMNPDWLVWMHQNFRRGFLREAAIAWTDIAETDDRLISVIPKATKAVTRHGWEVTVLDGMEKDARAAKHKKAVEFCFSRISALDAWNRNMTGDTNLLFRQMMTAKGMKYAAHELIWKPVAGQGITLQTNFVPLWFFENTTGRLRFLTSDYNLYGTDCQPGDWMISSGDGLLKSCAILYFFKHLPLRDWLIFCEKFGQPGLHGETNAQKGSAEWNDFVDALKNFSADWAMATSPGSKVTLVAPGSAAGELAYPKLIEWADKAMATMWRGGDLSTGSHSSGSGKGQGASLQGGESEILEQDDAEWLSSTLNSEIIPHLIRYQFGDEQPLAEIRIKTGENKDIPNMILRDTFLLSAGVPISIEDLAQDYGTTLPDSGEALAHAPAAAPANGAGGSARPGAEATAPSNTGADGTAPSSEPAAGANAESEASVPSVVENSLPEMAAAIQERFKIVGNPLAAIVADADKPGADPKDIANRLLKFRDSIPGFMPQLAKQRRLETALNKLSAAAFANGVAEAAKGQVQSPRVQGPKSPEARP